MDSVGNISSEPPGHAKLLHTFDTRLHQWSTS